MGRSNYDPCGASTRRICNVLVTSSHRETRDERRETGGGSRGILNSKFDSFEIRNASGEARDSRLQGEGDAGAGARERVSRGWMCRDARHGA